MHITEMPTHPTLFVYRQTIQQQNELLLINSDLFCFNNFYTLGKIKINDTNNACLITSISCEPTQMETERLLSSIEMLGW